MTADPAGPLGADERALCAACARWLAACMRCGAAVGLGAAACACALLLLRPGAPWGAGAVLLLLPVERLLALRLHFDAGLFADLAAGRLQPATLDAALATLGLRQPSATPRTLPQRVAGARRLAWQHLGVALAQAAALAATLPLWSAAR